MLVYYIQSDIYTHALTNTNIQDGLGWISLMDTKIRKTLLLVNDNYFDIKAIFSQDLSQPRYYKLIA